MEIFDQRSLALIPRWARLTVMAFLALATVLSAAAALWLALTHGSDTLAVALLSIFKASAIGCALWFFFLMGQRAQGRADLLRQTSRILSEEIPASLHIYGRPDEIKLAQNGQHMAKGIPNAVDVAVDHTPGTVHASYAIKWPGLAPTLKAKAHLNVRVLSVVYGFPGTDLATLETALAGTLAASANMDWKEEYRGFRRGGDGNADGVELWLRMRLSPDFLHEPTEQLFVTNDFAAMTRAIMFGWGRHGGTPKS